MATSLEHQDMNEWWNEMDDNDNNEKENSISQSSMSLSHTLPSTQALRLADYSTASSDIQSIKPKQIHSNLTPTPQPNPSQPIHTNNIVNNHETKLNDDHETNSESKSNDIPLNITYDDKNFSKFNKTYKFKKCNKNTNSSSPVNVYRITSHRSLDLCFKETIIGNNDDLKRCVNELKSLKRFYNVYYNETGLNTDNMVNLYINKKKGSTSYPKKARLVMKYHEGEDLDDFLVDEEDGEVGFLYEDDFRAIMKKILYQLSICHSQGILHCDLKPNNIRINEQSDKYEEDDPNYYDVNIIDFGFSHVFKDKLKGKKDVKLSYIKGTPGFIAPETIKNKKYSDKSDMFSLGCVAFFLLTNNYAVIQSTEMNVEDMLPDRTRIKRLLKRENDRNRDDESRIQQSTIDFVLSCLWKNPSKRPTAAQALNNKIFQ